MHKNTNVSQSQSTIISQLQQLKMLMFIILIIWTWHRLLNLENRIIFLFGWAAKLFTPGGAPIRKQLLAQPSQANQDSCLHLGEPQKRNNSWLSQARQLFTPGEAPNANQLWAQLCYIKSVHNQVLPEQCLESCSHPGQPQRENNFWDIRVQKQVQSFFT